jgi:MHS family alpha-ketoglutarate permease-like MFS transporter
MKEILSMTSTPHYGYKEMRKRIFSIIAASSGNLVEWFDFTRACFQSLSHVIMHARATIAA